MKTKHYLLLLLSGAALTALTSCEKETPAEEAADDLGDAIEEVGDNLADSVEEATEN